MGSLKKLWVPAIFAFTLVTFFAGSLPAKDLSLNLMTPPKHLRNVNVVEPWIKLVQERTKGAVTIKPYFSNTLSPLSEMYDSTVSGVSDIAESYTFAVPGRFQLTEFLMLPEMGFPSSLSCSRAMWQLYKTFPEIRAEYPNVKVLWLYGVPSAKLMTKKKAVRTLEDLKGLKIAVSGATMVKVAKSLGFTPVTIPTPDLYEAAEKGVIDGFVRPNELLVSRKLYEVTKYVTDIDLGHDVFYVIMNQKSWDSLTPENQKALTELSGDWAVDFTGKAQDKFDAEAAAEAKTKHGVEFITLSASESARWKKLLAPIKGDYAAELEAKKLAGKKILDALNKMAEKK
jgi:TRAP-type C4-dicarboxylate transport system substrate-binding protein